MSIPELHNSDIQTWKRCRRKWDFTSPYGQFLEPIIPNKNLWLGSMVHAALADYYEGFINVGLVERFKEVAFERCPENLSPEEAEVFQDSIDLGCGMLEHYNQWSIQADSPYDVVATEIKFEVPITDTSGKHIFTFAGTFDGLFWDTINKEFVLLETKTAEKMGPFEFLEFDEQITNYLLAAKMVFDFPVAGVLYNVLRKKLPTVPKVLKNGSLSKAKNVVTTYETYYQTILDNELSFEDYYEHLEWLQSEENPFFYRELISRSDYQLGMAQSELIEVAQEMYGFYFNHASRTRDCVWDCSFLAPCQMVDDGWDIKEYMQENYQHRELEHRKPKYNVKEINERVSKTEGGYTWE